MDVCASDVTTGLVVDGRLAKKILEIIDVKNKRQVFLLSEHSFSIIYTSKQKKMNKSRNFLLTKGK